MEPIAKNFETIFDGRSKDDNLEIYDQDAIKLSFNSIVDHLLLGQHQGQMYLLSQHFHVSFNELPNKRKTMKPRVLYSASLVHLKLKNDKQLLLYRIV